MYCNPILFKPKLFFFLYSAFKSDRKEWEEIAAELYMTVCVDNFPPFVLFVLAFIPDMDVLCVSASLSLGAASLYNRLAGPPVLIQSGKEEAV